MTPEEEAYVLERAYIPEHIVNSWFLFQDNWLILVGYPLEANFSRDRRERILEQVVETF
jgi:hypothetical protein